MESLVTLEEDGNSVTTAADGAGDFSHSSRSRSVDLLESKDDGRASWKGHSLFRGYVGSLGLAVPHIRTREQVERVIRYGKYGPMGERGLTD